MRYLCIEFEDTLKRKPANAVPVQRIWCECHHMRCLCSGFEATLQRKSANAVPVQRIWYESHHMRCLRSGFEEVGGMGAGTSGALVKHAFSSKVSVLPRREHRLFENRLGGVPLSDFTVTLHLQCNLTELGNGLLLNTPLPHAKA